uniref:AP2/ERF and B3 domain-containing transcription factor At1g50680-like n=1 Tax=Erigeron canadensis TaxID=72917 RepID=UPI001CB88D4F|nr:AP2/ERF and B3 domain-containing transcription factor At1g50680-like [Erigeron canadensis]XP_043624514.1 AP2/ERF and B3 domain-containing transcription factor At1g50680-like [Erigeron canadensis]
MSSGSNVTIITRETWDDSNNRNKCRRGTQNLLSQRSKSEAHPGHKGVILQHNMNWGCQIYFNNERIWLGTFKTEKEAGMAYDSAALKLRNGSGGNFDRNFPWTNLTIHELSFQRWFSKEAVLNMIRDGSYPSKLADYINLQESAEQDIKPSHSLDAAGGLFGRRLFQKELTPSDVGRLNRLVIPKKSAMEFFPPVPTGERGQNVELVELTFYDRSMRIWKFRYCYWKSSQSFVFTRGWNKFVSSHNLRPRDVITFFMCPQPPANMNNAAVIYVIEVTHRNQVHYDIPATLTVDDDEDVKGGITLHPIKSMPFLGVEDSKGVSVKMEEDENGLVERKEGFKLFGVQIC